MDIALHRKLLEDISKGKETALAELYGIFKGMVYNTALSYLQVQHAAEEVTQDVFVKIYQGASSFEGKSAPSTWIYRITINKAKDYLDYQKRQKRFGFVSSLFPGDEAAKPIDLPVFDHPGAILENKENARILFQVIDLLPEQQKTAFILSYVEDLARQEVADVMELSLKAVESLLQRAKNNLRKKLEDFRPQSRRNK